MRLESLKMSLKYFLDKGIYIVLIFLVPALLLPMLFSPSCDIYLFATYDTVDLSSFSAIYLALRQLPLGLYYIGAIGFVLACLMMAILFGIIDRHMRVGDFSLLKSNMPNILNSNILTASIFVLLTIVLYEFVSVVKVAFYLLWAVLFGNSVTWLVFAIITFALLSVLIIVVMSALVLFPAYMSHTGLRFFSAIRVGASQLGSDFWDVLLSFVSFGVIVILIQSLSVGLGGGVVARSIIDGLAIAIFVPFFVVLMHTIFYKVNGTERGDLIKTQIWSKKMRK